VAEWVVPLVSGIGVVVAAIALIVSIRNAGRQREADRRSFIFPLWEHINHISHIDPTPDKIVAEDARRALNALKLVALCWEGQVVNRRMIALAFGRTYMDLYEELAKANFVSPGYSASWRDMINNEGAVRRVYLAIDKEITGSPTLDT
jgi:hypothetical protein